MFKGYPQPWRRWLLALTALIFALIIVQLVTQPSSWVLPVFVLALIAIQVGMTYYVRRKR